MASEFTINLFENRTNIQAASLLCDYFQIDFDDVLSELFAHTGDEYDIFDFIKHFNLNLLNSFYDCVKIVCRHSTTIHDDFTHLKTNGLQNLKNMLDSNTPLSAFLFNNGIIVSVTNKTITVDGFTYPILHRDQCCVTCVFDAPKCNDIFNKGKFDYKHCDYRKAISLLENKLYYDKCETEVFIDATLEDIYSYTSVRYAPEILMTIQSVIKYLNKKPISLESLWREIPNNKYCILEFEIDIFALEFKCSKVMYETYNEIADILTYHGYSEYDFSHDNVSIELYKNLYILRKLVNKFFWEYSSDQYGQILPTTQIDWKDIRIIRQHGINELVDEHN